MTIRISLLALLLLVVPVFAQEVGITSPFDENDIIGPQDNFDVYDVLIGRQDDTTFTAYLEFNYGAGDATLVFNSAGVDLVPGDVLFGKANTSHTLFNQNGILNAVWNYGIPIGSDLDLDLYNVTSIQTAAQVLNNPNVNYRPWAPVLMGGATARNDATVGSSGDSRAGLDPSVALLFVINFDTKEAADVFAESDRVFFASATCGNDYWYSDITWEQDVDPIPEPMTMSLMGAGLLGLAVLKRRRK